MVPEAALTTDTCDPKGDWDWGGVCEAVEAPPPTPLWEKR